MKKLIFISAIIGTMFTTSCSKKDDPQPIAQTKQLNPTSPTNTVTPTVTVNIVDSLKNITWYAYKQELYTNGTLTNSNILTDTSTFSSTNWLQKLGYTNYNYGITYKGYYVIKNTCNGSTLTSQPFDTLKLNIINDSMITFTTGVNGGQYNVFYYKK